MEDDGDREQCIANWNLAKSQLCRYPLLFIPITL